MAQRLVRRLCPHCKQAYEPKREELPGDFPFDVMEEPIYRATGCRECRGIGYSGRMGIYELLVTNEEIRDLANERASSWEIKKAAVKNGMKTLRVDGWRKVLKGSTTVDEILRITKGDRGLDGGFA